MPDDFKFEIKKQLMWEVHSHKYLSTEIKAISNQIVGKSLLTNFRGLTLKYEIEHALDSYFILKVKVSTRL